MEKRFELKHDKIFVDVYDNELNSNRIMDAEEIFDLFNEQNEKIKELEKDVNLWKSKAEHMLNVWKDQSAKDLKKIYDFAEEIQQLKQSQNSKAIEVLDKVKKYCENWKTYGDYYNYVLVEETSGVRTIQNLYEFINNQMTELKGENNGKL